MGIAKPVPMFAGDAVPIPLVDMQQHHRRFPLFMRRHVRVLDPRNERVFEGRGVGGAGTKRPRAQGKEGILHFEAGTRLEHNFIAFFSAPPYSRFDQLEDSRAG